MKKYTPLLLILLLTSCYTTQVYRYEPYMPLHETYDQGKKIAYQNNDSVIVSVAFQNYYEGICSIEATIDNQSSQTVEFDPKNAYLFRYNTDSTLADNAIYYALDPKRISDSLDKKIDNQHKKLVGNTFFSIFLGMAYIAANVASVGNENLADGMDAITVVHDAAQITLDVAREVNVEKTNEFAFQKQNLANTALIQSSISPRQFAGGNLQFYVPYSPFYKIYLSVNNRIYSYTFQGIQQNQ
jgi:hypothetical protein